MVEYYVCTLMVEIYMLILNQYLTDCFYFGQTDEIHMKYYQLTQQGEHKIVTSEILSSHKISNFFYL